MIDHTNTFKTSHTVDHCLSEDKILAHERRTHQELQHETEGCLQAVPSDIYSATLNKLQRVAAGLIIDNRLISILTREAFTTCLLDKIAQLSLDTSRTLNAMKHPGPLCAHAWNDCDGPHTTINN